MNDSFKYKLNQVVLLGVDKELFLFQITSTRISDEDTTEKKHIIYTLQVRHALGKDDSHISTIDRRYTDFLNLYTALRNEHPNLLTSVNFPKKVLVGNFDTKLISERSTAFELFLKHISNDSRLRSSHALLKFLQDGELKTIKEKLRQKEYGQAMPLLENNFRLLNKVYTDRSPAVLLALCRLLGCSMEISEASAQKWADLALHRYNGVSDSDLLELYIPLLQMCLKVWGENGREKEALVNQLNTLKKQGAKIDSDVNFLNVINRVELKLFAV